jgi:hypothetical protein
MKPGGGKRKGGSFERLIAKELSTWWTGGKNDRVFWRTHSSGALGTVSKMRTEYGDLMAVDDAGRAFMEIFNIELRHSRELDVSDLVYGSGKSGMAKFIQEGRRSAMMSRREPIWIFKEHQGPVMVMMDPITLTHTGQSIIVMGVAGAFPIWDVFVMEFEDWKKFFDKAAFLKEAPTAKYRLDHIVLPVSLVIPKGKK